MMYLFKSCSSLRSYELLCTLLTPGCGACWELVAAVTPLTPFWVLTLTSFVIDLQYRIVSVTSDRH